MARYNAIGREFGPLEHAETYGRAVLPVGLDEVSNDDMEHWFWFGGLRVSDYQVFRVFSVSVIERVG